VNKLPNVSEIDIDGLSIRWEHVGANAFHLGEQLFYPLCIVDD